MKKQIIAIGLMIVFVLASSFAQARGFRHKRSGVIIIPSQDQTQKATDQNQNPEPVQDNDKPEPKDIQDNGKPESKDIKEKGKPESEDVQDIINPESDDVQDNTKLESDDVEDNIKPESDDVQNNAKQESDDVEDNGKPEPEQTQSIIQVEQAAQSKDFYVTVSVDHENGVYEEGELMNVTVESNKSGYLYLFSKDPNGNVVVLFPNAYHQQNKIRANKKVLIPGDDMNFKFRATAPFGNETLQAIVTRKPIDVKSIINFENDNVFCKLSADDVDVFEKAINQGKDSKNQVAEFTISTVTKPKEQAAPVQKKRIFIGICVSKSSVNTSNVLPPCEKDLAEMGRFFNDNGAVDVHESLIYCNEDATKEKIRDLFFNYLPNHTNPGDEVFIYWTGFCGRCVDINGDEKDGYDEALLLYDSDPKDITTQLVDDEFCLWALNLRGRKVVFIFDVSYGFAVSEFTSMKSLGMLNFALITSSSVGQPSLVMKDQKMSVMTSFLVDNLKKNQKISHKKLFSKVKSQVSKYVKKEYEIEQTMIMVDGLDSPMIFNP